MIDPSEPAGVYSRECDRCYANETTEHEHPEHEAWICGDCRAECHDHDDQGD